MARDIEAGSNLKRNTRIVGSRSSSSDEGRKREVAGRRVEGEEGEEVKKEKENRTKIDKTSLWIPAACTAGRPHCSKCPARYEIMSVCIPRHKDNLSRLRPVEYLLSALLEALPYLRFHDFASYFQSRNTRDKLPSRSFPLGRFFVFGPQSFERCPLALRSVSKSLDLCIPMIPAISSTVFVFTEVSELRSFAIIPHTFVHNYSLPFSWPFATTPIGIF